MIVDAIIGVLGIFSLIIFVLDFGKYSKNKKKFK